MNFKIKLKYKTHPEVDAPLKPIQGKIPTENELKLSVEDVLGEVEDG